MHTPILCTYARYQRANIVWLALGARLTPVFCLDRARGGWQGQRRHRWASRDGRSRQVDRHTLRALYVEVHGQQDTVLCDDCSAARRERPLVNLCAPAVPGSPVGSGHPDTHRTRTGSTSRLGAIVARRTAGRDAV